MKKIVNAELKTHVKIGEKVKIISGKEKGKIGLVKKILKKNRLLIENINMGAKHMKPLRPGENGEIKRIECPIHSSNVSLYKE
ncbi:unnamed protein product [Pylaiella littoralis]